MQREGIFLPFFFSLQFNLTLAVINNLHFNNNKIYYSQNKWKVFDFTIFIMKTKFASVMKLHRLLSQKSKMKKKWWKRNTNYHCPLHARFAFIFTLEKQERKKAKRSCASFQLHNRYRFWLLLLIVVAHRGKCYLCPFCFITCDFLLFRMLTILSGKYHLCTHKTLTFKIFWMKTCGLLNINQKVFFVSFFGDKSKQ